MLIISENELESLLGEVLPQLPPEGVASVLHATLTGPCTEDQRLATYSELIGGAPAAELEPVEVVAGAEVLGLYFSAAWCPACRRTTPLVASAYSAIRSRGHQLQIVYVSQDASEAEFDQYRAAMPWPALPFGGTRAALLAEAFSVQSIPTLVLLRPDGTLISTDGIRLMRKHTRAFPWLSKLPPPMTPHVDAVGGSCWQRKALLTCTCSFVSAPRERVRRAAWDARVRTLPYQVLNCRCVNSYYYLFTIDTTACFPFSFITPKINVLCIFVLGTVHVDVARAY